MLHQRFNCLACKAIHSPGAWLALFTQEKLFRNDGSLLSFWKKTVSKSDCKEGKADAEGTMKSNINVKAEQCKLSDNCTKCLEYGNRDALDSESEGKPNSARSMSGANLNMLCFNKVKYPSNKICNLSITMEKYKIPFSYEKPYEQWWTLHLDVRKRDVDEMWSPMTKRNKITVSLSDYSHYLASPANAIIKRAFSSFAGDPTHKGVYMCQGSTKTTSGEKSKKDNSVVKQKKKKQQCDRHPAPGCKVPESLDCKQHRSHPPCDIKPAPSPSYSECLRYPPPPHQFTECHLKRESTCPPDSKTKSYDGCAKKSEREELVCPEKPAEKKKDKVQKKRKGRPDDCDAESGECVDEEPFKLKSGYMKPALKCSANQQPLHRSYSCLHQPSRKASSSSVSGGRRERRKDL